MIRPARAQLPFIVFTTNSLNEGRTSGGWQGFIMVQRKGVAAIFSVLLLSSTVVLSPVEAKKSPAQSKPAAVQTKQFTYDPKVNEQMAKKLKIPVYFAIPASARLQLPDTIDTTDKLVDFKHPDGVGAQGDVGLRLVVAKRAGMAKRLAKSGLVQTGDILLTFRSEWGGGGPYPNIQMGISHTGVAFVKDGTVYNIDNPLDGEYIGRDFKSQLNSSHYNTLNFIHIIRPRNLTDSDKANISAWATRLTGSARSVYPKEISFNQDYNDPKYKSGKPITFVKQLGQIGLGQNPPGNVGMYCSEFAWSLLALRQCDPNASSTADAFKGSSIPSCVKPIMTPMDATGSYIFSRSRSSYAGLADGPLLVVDSLKLPNDKESELLKSVFVENPKVLSKMSVGHRQIAEKMKPNFSPLETYYVDAATGGWGRWRARGIRFMSNRKVPDNYSPTSYLINTLLPPDNSNRVMDYVATVAVE
jgi:hypothetical protein